MIWCFIGSQRYFDIIRSTILFWFWLLLFYVYYSILRVMNDISKNQQLTYTSLFNFSLAATRRSTFSESLEICLNNPWYRFQSLISPFKFSVWSTRSFYFIPLMASKREGYTVKLFFQIISWNTNLTLIHSILYHPITIKLFLSFH